MILCDTGPLVVAFNKAADDELQVIEAAPYDYRRMSDRRDFQVVAPRHLRKGERLKLLPEN